LHDPVYRLGTAGLDLQEAGEIIIGIIARRIGKFVSVQTLLTEESKGLYDL
jgi:hypothetical protein